MKNDNEGNFSALHQQFLANIDPETSRLPTPLVKATTEFSETLRKALVSHQKNTGKAEELFQTALQQRDNLLENEQVKNDPHLTQYLNEVIVVSDESTAKSLQETWNKHANSYNEASSAVTIPDMPEGFQSLHTQFWEYVETTQDTLNTGTQKRVEEFSKLLGTSMAEMSGGNTDEAHRLFELCQDMRKALLEDPKITQNKDLTHYISNVMADNGDTRSSLRTTAKWHSDASDLTQAQNSNEPLFEQVRTIDENEKDAPLLSDEEWEEYTNPYPKDNILDFPER
ncbi:MAG: hypothetical protein COA45_02125 [Zetaproteobacteria bacterium]|nr:MAG: hypothetical protein COA45_02125 [Zetaproteobacteria bacterium]